MPILAFEPISELTQCNAETIKWSFVGAQSSGLSLIVLNNATTNTPIPNVPTSSTSAPPSASPSSLSTSSHSMAIPVSSRTVSTNATTTPTLPNTPHHARDASSITNVTLAINLNPESNVFNWSFVNLTTGSYEILAVIPPYGEIGRSQPFLIGQGNGTSCLLAAPSATAGINGAIASQTSLPVTKRKSRAATIVGGILGTLLGIACLTALWVYCFKHRPRRNIHSFHSDVTLNTADPTTKSKLTFDGASPVPSLTRKSSVSLAEKLAEHNHDSDSKIESPDLFNPPSSHRRTQSYMSTNSVALSATKQRMSYDNSVSSDNRLPAYAPERYSLPWPDVKQPPISPPRSPVPVTTALSGESRPPSLSYSSSPKSLRKAVPIFVPIEDEVPPLPASLSPPQMSPSTGIPQPEEIHLTMPDSSKPAHYTTRSKSMPSVGEITSAISRSNTFGPGSIAGKPLHFLVPDMPMPIKD